MASEYLRQKYKDVKPDEPRELTPKERRSNWWYYHKWHVIVGVILLAIPISIAWNALTAVKPDCQVAYVGTNALPDDTVAALERELSSLCGDINGDGKEAVQLVQYISGDTEAAYSYEIKLTGDLLDCESYLFLIENPEQFQRSYHSLCRLDGSLPDDGDFSYENVCLAWSQCPVLTQMELGDFSYSVMGEAVSGSSQEVLSGLYIARRGFWTEKTVPNIEGCNALWEKLTEGAIS